MKFNDAIVGAAFVALSLTLIALASGFHTPPGQKFGPGFFPIITASAMGLAGLGLVVKGIANRAAQPWVAIDPWFRVPRLAVHGASIFASLIAYLLFSETL